MNIILASKMLAQAVFGLNDGAFMMFVVVFLLLACSICVGLAVVFREKRIIRPAAEPAKAFRETSVDGFSTVEANTENTAVGTGVGCEQPAAGEEVVSKAFTENTKGLSAVEQAVHPTQTQQLKGKK